MAGSLHYYNYQTDDGVAATIFRDKSNSEAQANGATLCGAFGGAPGLSSFIKPRYVNTTDAGNPLRKRRFVVGTTTVFNAIADGATISERDGTTWNVTSKRGEKRRLGSSVDTGQTA